IKPPVPVLIDKRRPLSPDVERREPCHPQGWSAQAITYMWSYEAVAGVPDLVLDRVQGDGLNGRSPGEWLTETRLGRGAGVSQLSQGPGHKLRPRHPTPRRDTNTRRTVNGRMAGLNATASSSRAGCGSSSPRRDLHTNHTPGARRR